MKKTIALIIMFVVGLSLHTVADAQNLTPEALNVLADRYQYFIVIPPMGDEPLRYMYADIGPHVHVFDVREGKAEVAWETGNMGAPVSALLLADPNQDGTWSIIVATRNGRLIAYDAITYERAWENFQEPFKTISCVTLHNIDADPQQEVIIVGESALGGGSSIYIFDSVTRGLDWKSQENFTATEILVGNVDSDPQPEIILNSGFVIDSKFFNIDLIKREGGGFGDEMTLEDLNNDGYPEVIGRVPNRSIRIFDVYAERDLW